MSTARATAVFLSIACLFGGCDSDQHSQPAMYSKIVLDDAHNVAAANPNDVLEYKVAAAKGLVLDTSQLQIVVPEKFGVDGPNAIHIVQGEKGYYRASWRVSTELTLDAKTLERIRGASHFQGLQSGEHVVLAIGYDNLPPPSGDSISFKVMWAGKLNVE